MAGVELKNIFNTAKALLLRIPDNGLYVLLLFSLIVIEYFNFHLCPDVGIQLHTLKNFVSGHGITLTGIDKNNLIVYEPVSLWPAGFVILLSPVYLITKAAIITTLVGKFIAFIFYILFLAKYMQHLQLEKLHKKIIILFCIFSVSPFIHFYPADAMATVLCLWGFYFNLSYQQNEKKGWLLASIFLMALSYFVKYSFLPFLFYPLAAFVLKERTTVFKKPAQFATIFFVTLAAGFIFYQLNILLVGKTALGMGFDAFKGNAHWNQLSHANGFLFGFGVVYEWAYQNFLRDHFGLHIRFNLLAIFVTACFYLFFISAFLKKKMQVANSPFINSINISLSAGGLICFFLYFLSINNPGQTWMTPYWTFVEESRYYGPVIVIGLLNILILLLQKKKVLAYLIIAGFCIINICAYDYAVHHGFWGINADTYFKMRKALPPLADGNQVLGLPIVYFDEAAKKSDEYYYLLSQGIILVEKSQYSFFKNNDQKYTPYFLKRDAADAVKLSSAY